MKNRPGAVHLSRLLGLALVVHIKLYRVRVGFIPFNFFHLQIDEAVNLIVIHDIAFFQEGAI